MLEVRGLQAAYGHSQVLFDMNLSIAAGQVATLLGRNGMGKTTTIHTIMGLVPPKGGEVSFEGQSLKGRPAFKVARAGLGLVPEGRQIFPNLSVEENLVATARPGVWTLRRIYDLFPRLEERRSIFGNRLSGGEQQMLAIGRALLTNPKLLILDEATEGLAPLVRDEIWQCLTGLKAEGQSILVVDKNIDALNAIADQHFIVEKGRVVWSGSPAALEADPGLRQRYLGVCMTIQSGQPQQTAATTTVTNWPCVMVAVLGGSMAALHVGKVPPALPAIRAELAIDLVTAGWLMALVSGIGAVLGLLSGRMADRIGHRDAMIIGLALLAAGSIGGALAGGIGMLLVTRGIEGLGLILTIVAAPALINRSTAPGDMRLTLAIWGVWLPAGVATMMLVAPLLMAPFGWRGLWVAAALACVLAVVLLIRVMPGSVSRPGGGTPVSLVTAMVMTARRPAAWVLGGCFIAYSMSFMSVFGFLPTLMVEEVGLATGTASVLCAIAVLFNAGGNVLAGAAARRGIARWVLIAGPFVTLTLCSILVYSSSLPFWLRYGAALLYALTGGLLPATIMGSLPVFAARPDLVGTMSGFVMQGSNIGQLIGPPLIALVVAANGWHAAPFYIAGATGLGLILALRLRPLERGLGRQL